MRRLLVAAIVAATLAGCSVTAQEPPPEQPVWKVTEVPVPQVTAPAGEGGSTIPTPHISVEVTTEPPAPAQEPGGADAPASVERSVTQGSADYASQLVTLANGARADAGVSRLGSNSCAKREAVARAGRALVKSSLEHEPLPDCGSWVGENLARHYGTPRDMHEAWMNSPGHRENILRPEFTSVGVGCVAYSREDRQRKATRADDVGGYVCAQVFVG